MARFGIAAFVAALTVAAAAMAGSYAQVQRSEYNYDSGWVQRGGAYQGCDGCGAPVPPPPPSHGCDGCQAPTVTGCGGPNGIEIHTPNGGAPIYVPPCEGPRGGYYSYGGGYADQGAYADQGYGYGDAAYTGYDYHAFWKNKGPYRPLPACCTGAPHGCGQPACGSAGLPVSFFSDSGGVGPAWISSGGGGGGFVYAGGGARASAYASARASVRISGGGRGHHGGHGGGCGCH